MRYYSSHSAPKIEKYCINGYIFTSKGWIQYFWRKKTFLDIQDFSLWGKYNWTFLYEFRALWAALVTASLCSSASSSKTVVEIVEWHRHNQRQLLSCWRNAVQSSSSSAAVLAEHLQCSVLVDRYIAQIFVPIKVLILLGSPPLCSTLLLNYLLSRQSQNLKNFLTCILLCGMCY